MTNDSKQDIATEYACWCGGEVGPRIPGDEQGMGCQANIMHNWRACTCPPAQIVGSGGDVIDQDSDPDCPVHGSEWGGGR